MNKKKTENYYLTLYRLLLQYKRSAYTICYTYKIHRKDQTPSSIKAKELKEFCEELAQILTEKKEVFKKFKSALILGEKRVGAIKDFNDEFINLLPETEKENFKKCREITKKL